MIILGDKYHFTECELAVMEKLFGTLHMLDINDDHFSALKEKIDGLLSREGNQMIVINSRKNPFPELTGYLTNLSLHGNVFLTMEELMETHLRKCHITRNERDISSLVSFSPYTPFQYFQKRLLDYSAALTLLAIGLPIMLYTAYRIKKESPGPVFYLQRRVGIKGRPFKLIKFRSMHVDAHHDPYTHENDSRIFPFGNFMRKAHIDELPQLFNVLRGEMHIVGPRPEWDILVDRYEHELPFYQVRHLVRPGITGHAQVNYTYGGGVDDAHQKLMFDFYYVKHWSLAKDVAIMAKTFLHCMKKNGT
jgi:lipopolysaccharide/colanic/teichoic acid biosynthesis glycosyltransferase